MRGEVDVFGVDLARSDKEVKELAGVLAGDELRRAANMRIEAGRRRFIVARSSLRLLLGTLLSADPAGLEFVCGANGKPSLDPSDDLRFNVSHSGELALVAVARLGEVGVDIEQIRPRRDPMRVARRYFTLPECEAIAAAGVEGSRDRLIAFYRHWVAKEAYVKATGSGIAASLRSFSVELDSPPRIVDPSGSGGLWTLSPLEVGGGYASALVAEQSLDMPVEVRAFDPLGTGSKACQG